MALKLKKKTSNSYINSMNPLNIENLTFRPVQRKLKRNIDIYNTGFA